jgi:hypothetical protein
MAKNKIALRTDLKRGWLRGQSTVVAKAEVSDKCSPIQSDYVKGLLVFPAVR